MEKHQSLKQIEPVTMISVISRAMVNNHKVNVTLMGSSVHTIIKDDNGEAVSDHARVFRVIVYEQPAEIIDNLQMYHADFLSGVSAVGEDDESEAEE